jgi:hypothetical protein
MPKIHSNIKSTDLKAIIQVFVFSLLFNNDAVGQYNLVQNPSFEQCVNCPTNGGAEVGAQFTNNVILPFWNNPSSGEASPDYYHFNTAGEQAFDGNSMIGIITFFSIFDPQFALYNNGREYLQSELLDSLLFKKYYLIEFYTYVGGVLGQGGFLANNFGLHFSDTSLHTSNFYNIPLLPQIKYFKNEIIDTSNSWIKVSSLYEAIGGEKYMTVGNFNTDSETDFICLYPFWPAEGKCYMLFDKFSVIPLDSIPGGLQVNAGQDYSICPGDTVFIGEKISNLPANWYLLDGTIVDTNTAGVYVHPSITTTYVVTMTINGVYSTDTVTVTVGCAGIDEQMNRSFAIGPNPNDGTFVVSGAFSEGEQIILTTLDGKRVYTQVLPSNSEQEHVCTKLNPGTYFFEVWTAQGSRCFCDKIVIF